MLYKIRRLVNSDTQQAYGITIPNDIAILRQGTLYRIEISGTSIILSSGNRITAQDVRNFDWRGVEI